MVKEKHVRPFYLDDDADVEITLDDTGDVNQLANVHWTTGWVCSKLRHKECVDRVSADSNDINKNVTFLAGLKKFTEASRIFNPGVRICQYFSTVCKLFEEHFMLLLRIDTVGVKEDLMDIILTKFGFAMNHENAGTDQNITDGESGSDLGTEEKLLLDVLCTSCAVRITNKYVNMLIACKIGQLNNTFNEKAQSKRKLKKHEKAKKLNIVTFSKLLAQEPSDHDEKASSKKKKSSLPKVG